MKVFISSVRRDLERERDALPGLIAAIGHEPLRFEDFTAQPMPSREACVKGVQRADAYLLIVGPHYGHVFADTGQSPTNDEWTAAAAAGIPRLVYVKQGVTFDADQRTFLSEIEAYEHGVFRDEYSDAAELLTKVAAKIRELADAPGALTFAPLPAPVTVDWLRADVPWRPTSNGVLEVHVVPPAPTSRSSREMLALAEALPARIRTSPLVGQSRALSPSRDAGGITIELPRERHVGGFGQTSPAELLGIRVSSSGDVSAWTALPGDGMGSVVEPATIGSLVADMLRLIGLTGGCGSGPVAIAIGIFEPMLVTVDALRDGGRTSAAVNTNGGPVRLAPDEVVSLASLHDGAAEMGDHLGAALIDALRRPRR